ncbi:MAG: nucleotide exchange factor GrpE [Rhodobacteraceae bacterium]|nr:nucleotide exchange factor GrpE [Paracoccaceae bacterium]
MSDENQIPEDIEAEAAASAEEANAAAEPELDPIEVLKAENADLKDRALRTMAEMENLRRRTEKEIKDAKTYAVSSFARDMLTVCDNLGRAVDSLTDEARATVEDAGLKAFIEGVEMTERDLLSQLDKNGVKKLFPEGEKFDPNFHQAMFEVPNTEVPNNTVVQVVQQGYSIGNRVLRPAMVGVAKGGPKPAPAADADDGVDKSV